MTNATRIALLAGAFAASMNGASCIALAADPEVTENGRTALVASDGRGEIDLVWFPGPFKLGSASYRIVEVRGSATRTVLDRIAPGDAAYRGALSDNDFAFAQDVPKIINRAETKRDARPEQLLGLRVYSDFAFAEAAGFARRLRVDGSGTRQYRIVGLDASGAPNGTTLDSAPVDPAVVSPKLPPAVAGMRAIVVPDGVALTWNPPASGGATVLAYVIERSAGGRTLALTTSPILTGTTWKPDTARFVDRGAPLDADVTYSATAIDTFGRRGPAGSVTVATFAARALAPLVLTARSAATGTTLEWKPRANPHLAGYILDRGTSTNGPFEVLTKTPLEARSSSFTDGTTRSGTSYYYRLTAVGPRGDLGPPSNIAIVTMAKGPQPQAAGDVRVEALRTRIKVSWTAPGGSIAGYEVERRDGDGKAFVQINHAMIVGTSFVDPIGQTDGRVVDYRVIAVGGDGQHASPSAAVRATTFDATVPAPPVLVRGSTKDGIAHLQFRSAKNASARLIVYRSSNVTQTGAAISQPLAATAREYDDDTAPGGRRWFYRIVARSDAGATSAPSAVVGLTIASKTIPVPGAPRLNYTRSPYPHVAIAFAKPPPGFLTAVDVQTKNGRWSLVARATPGETATDARPIKGRATYRITYVDPSGRRGEPSATASIDIP